MSTEAIILISLISMMSGIVIGFAMSYFWVRQYEKKHANNATAIVKGKDISFVLNEQGRYDSRIKLPND